MDIRDYAQILRRGWPTIVIAVVLAIGLAIAYLAITPRTYSATSELLVTTQGSSTVSELQLGGQFTQQAVTTYARVAVSPKVLDPVISDLDLRMNADELAGFVTVTVETGTTLLDITATSSDARSAARISNAISASAIKVLSALDTPADPSAAALVNIQQVRSAETPTAPISPNTKTTLLIALFVGLVIGLAVIVTMAALDRRIRSARDLSSVSTRPLLAQIPRWRGARRQPLVVQDESSSAPGEAFRTLRTNLRFLEKGSRSFVVTSAEAADGKSLVAANLAWSLADAEYTVVLVDANLREPKVGALLGIEDAAGLADLLAARADLSEIIRSSKNARLSVVLAGTHVPNPSEAISSGSMRSLISNLESRFDYVVIDAPPVLSFTDAAVLSSFASASILTVAAGQTRSDRVTSALIALAKAGVEPVGIVLNKIRGNRTDPDGEAEWITGMRYDDKSSSPRRSRDRRGGLVS